MIRKHTLRTHNGVAELTEILNLLILMFEAVYFSPVGLMRNCLWLLTSIQIQLLAHGLVICRRSLVDTVYLIHHVGTMVILIHLLLLFISLTALDSSELSHDFHHLLIHWKLLIRLDLLCLPTTWTLAVLRASNFFLCHHTFQTDSMSAFGEHLGYSVIMIKLKGAIVALNEGLHISIMFFYCLLVYNQFSNYLL